MSIKLHLALCIASWSQIDFFGLVCVRNIFLFSAELLPLSEKYFDKRIFMLGWGESTKPDI